MAGFFVEEGPLLEPNLYGFPGRKPIGAAVIDWDHPLARGLERFYLFGENYEVVGGLVPEPIDAGTNVWSVAPLGAGRMALIMDELESQAASIDLKDTSFTPTTLGFSLLFRFKHDITAAGQMDITNYSHNANGVRLRITDAGGMYNILWASHNAGDRQQYEIATDVPINTIIDLAVTISAAGVMGIYYNGKGTTGGDTALAPVTTANPDRLLTQWDSNLEGGFYHAAKFNVFSEAGVLELTRDPYQFLIPA